MASRRSSPRASRSNTGRWNYKLSLTLPPDELEGKVALVTGATGEDRPRCPHDAERGRARPWWRSTSTAPARPNAPAATLKPNETGGAETVQMIERFFVDRVGGSTSSPVPAGQVRGFLSEPPPAGVRILQMAGVDIQPV